MAEVFDRRDLLALVDGDEEVLEDLVHIFMAHTPKQLHELRHILEAGDALGLREQAHALNGAAANLSAEECIRWPGNRHSLKKS